ncbi:hypothetical protein C8J57DRAFT_173683 [Mycena rebaudengoi]|nr:hypothetical protein C8J57DRAFT_173683 [Mycena rebaudengoi]
MRVRTAHRSRPPRRVTPARSVQSLRTPYAVCPRKAHPRRSPCTKYSALHFYRTQGLSPIQTFESHLNNPYFTGNCAALFWRRYTVYASQNTELGMNRTLLAPFNSVFYLARCKQGNARCRYRACCSFRTACRRWCGHVTRTSLGHNLLVVEDEHVVCAHDSGRRCWRRNCVVVLRVQWGARTRMSRCCIRFRLMYWKYSQMNGLRDALFTPTLTDGLSLHYIGTYALSSHSYYSSLCPRADDVNDTRRPVRFDRSRPLRRYPHHLSAS